ncbi:MAG: glycosyltransferase family 4 protein [bacterium]
MKSPRPIQLAMIADFPEENWESMNLIADMIEIHIRVELADCICVDRITPAYFRLFSRLSSSRLAWNIDRFINRRIVLTRGINKAIANKEYQAALVVDHSYAHVVRLLKKCNIKTIVICHDTDAIKPLFHKTRSVRSLLQQWFAKPIYEGIQAVDKIITVSDMVRSELVEHWKISGEKIQTLHNGTAPEFQFLGDNATHPLKANITEKWPVLVHVGTNTPRKRIDLLIDIIEQLKKYYPGLTCIRIGGDFNEIQKAVLAEKSLNDSFQVMPRLNRDEIAAIYRAASLVLITSDAEGFGLPLVEALSCGANVLASDLPVLREVGGHFAEYTPPGQLQGFVETARQMIDRSRVLPEPEIMQSRAAFLAKYSWSHYVRELDKLIKD